MKLLLHVGMDKTGSTAIQFYLSKNRERLLEHGICYPKTGAYLGQAAPFSNDGVRHITLKYALGNRIPNSPMSGYLDIYDEFSLRAFQERLISDLQQELSTNKNIRSVVMSDEDIFRLSTTSLANRTWLFAQQIFQDFRVLIYVRDLPSYLNSAYVQHIKTGGRKSFQDFCAIFLDGKYISKHIRAWQSTFGVDHLLLRPYPPARSQDVVEDFLHACGIPDLGRERARHNPSMSQWGVKMQRSINRYYYSRFDSKPPKYYRRVLEYVFSGKPDDYVAGLDADTQKALDLEQARIDALLDAQPKDG